MLSFFPIATSWVPIPSPAFPAKLASAHISRNLLMLLIRVVSRTKSPNRDLLGPLETPTSLRWSPCSALLCRVMLPLVYCSGHRDTGQASGPAPVARAFRCHLSSGSVITATQPVPSLWPLPCFLFPASGTQGSSGELTASKGHLRAALTPGPPS